MINTYILDYDLGNVLNLLLDSDPLLGRPNHMWMRLDIGLETQFSSHPNHRSHHRLEDWMLRMNDNMRISAIGEIENPFQPHKTITAMDFKDTSVAEIVAAEHEQPKELGDCECPYHFLQISGGFRFYYRIERTTGLFCLAPSKRTWDNIVKWLPMRIKVERRVI